MKTCKRNHQYEDNLKYCPICKANANKRWKDTNKVRERTNQKQWTENNKQYVADYKRSWSDLNRETQKIFYKEYKKRRRANDAIFKLRGNVRSLIGASFSNKGWKKNTKTQEILGCSYEELEIHLISSAKKNYGKYFPKRKYEIDHIIPLVTATTEEELIRLNHYSNLQYLYRRHNIEKSDNPDWTLAKSESIVF